MTYLDDQVSPPASAYAAEPLTISEIDAHPDGARIWATILAILAIRAEHEVVTDDLHERLYMSEAS